MQQNTQGETQADLLARIASEVRTGRMPVAQYLVVHPRARLSPLEEQLIYDWEKAERKHIRKQLAKRNITLPANESSETP